MTLLLDTNVLLRVAQPSHPMHDAARRALELLNEDDVKLCIVPQIIYEYWVVATRPVENNGLGMSVDDADASVESLTGGLQLFRDERAVFDNWRQLVVSRNVKGKPAHDARIVASMMKHSVECLLTFNVSDFRRFTEINVFTPDDVIDGKRP